MEREGPKKGRPSACLQVMCGFFMLKMIEREKREHDRNRRTNRPAFGPEAETGSQRKDFEEYNA